MYGVSAMQMAHNRWFSNKPAVTESEIAITAGVSDARAVARELMDRHGLRGELAQVRKAEGGLSFRIVRPGTVLSLTGIYLWFKIHTERIIGLILLTLSLGYSLTLIVLIRSAY
jgi:hypothetical protein